MAENKIVAPDRLASVVMQSGMMQDRFALWVQAITDFANRNIAGTGSPEGLIDAKRFTFYLDDATNDFYVKTTEQGTLTGWKSL